MEYQEITSGQKRCLKSGSFFAYVAIPLFIISLFCILATILIPILHGLLIILDLIAILLLILFTLGLIFMAENNPVIPMWEFINSSNTESIMGFATTCFNIAPYVAGAGVLVSLFSTIMLFSSKQKCTGKKVVAILFGILNLLVSGFYALIQMNAI